MPLNKIGTEEIETERLLLRKIAAGDIPKMFYGWASKAECCRYFPWEPAADYTAYRERALSWIDSYADGLFFQWLIVLKESGEPIGMINLHGVNEAKLSAETSYLLSFEHRGKGYMTEALSAVLEFAFEKAGFEEICADVFSGNVASEKVLQNCGMSMLKTEKAKYMKNGKPVDAAEYAIKKQ
jgi:ribosomal-protein-alanine N-acetyltransferase